MSVFTCYASTFLTHQSHNVPRVTAAEGLAEAEDAGNHDEDDVGADVDPDVLLHGLFDFVGEGEHAHHTEGEQQLDSQDAEHLHSSDGNVSLSDSGK